MRLAAIVTIFAAAGFAVPAEAARENERTVWRLQGGVNTSTLVGSDADRGDLERRQGAIAGVSFLVHMTSRVGVEFGGFYSQKGTKGKVSETEDFDIPFVSDSVEGTAEFHYLEFPLLVSFTFPVSQRFEAQVYAGPAVAIETTADIARPVPRDGASVPVTDDLSSHTTNFDALGIVGATGVLEVGPVNLLLGLRWARGLRSIDDSVMGLELFNSTFSLLAGIGIPTSGGSESDDGRRGVFQ